MTKHTFPMTEKGWHELKEELQELETVQRPKAKQRIKHARGFCDFHEDSEYASSLDSLAEIDQRINDLEYMIQQAEIIQPTRNSHVEIGSTVTFRDIEANAKETYMIVGPEEANPTQHKISYNSPVAQSLLGAAINDKVTIQTPNGEREVSITDIS